MEPEHHILLDKDLNHLTLQLTLLEGFYSGRARMQTPSMLPGKFLMNFM